MEKKSISERAIIGFDHGLPCRVENMASGLSNNKNLGLRPRFLSTESLGPCFSHGTGDHDQILQQSTAVQI